MDSSTRVLRFIVARDQIIVRGFPTFDVSDRLACLYVRIPFL